MEGQQVFLQNRDITELCFITEQLDRIFLVKKKSELLFPIYTFV